MQENACHHRHDSRSEKSHRTGRHGCIRTFIRQIQRKKQQPEHSEISVFNCESHNTEKHKKYVGADNKVITENLSVLDKVGAKAILRCPIIPDINDTKEHFKGIAATASAHGCITSVELMPYHPLGISKSQKIGKECLYWESEFLSKDTANTYAEAIQKLTEKKVTVSG